MIKIDSETKEIKFTRGDYGIIAVSTVDKDGVKYTFQDGDKIEFKIMEKNDVEKILFQKTFFANAGEDYIDVTFESEDTRFTDYIDKPKAFWYEITLNPDTQPQTIIGYEDSAKLFTLLPEGADKNVGN